MEYTLVGASSVSVSRVGFGCAAMGGYDYGPVDDGESIRAVYSALDCGITLFDIADVYGFGHAETVLGKALKGLATKGIVATKVGVSWDQVTRKTVRNVSNTYITQAIEASLRRLQVDCLDICQLHWPVDGVTPIEAIRPFERMQSEGKIRLIGVCNVDLQWLLAAKSCCRIDVLQLSCNILEQNQLPTMLSARRELKISTFAYNGLAHGLLSAKFDRTSRFPPEDLRNRVPAFKGERLKLGLLMAEGIQRVALSLNKTPSQVALRWLLDRQEISCVLTGIKTSDQAKNNALSTDWSLPHYACSYLSELADKSIYPKPAEPEPNGLN